MSRDDVYKLLKRAGHEPWKAGEISLDWQRGDEHARRWVDTLKRMDDRKE